MAGLPINAEAFGPGRFVRAAYKIREGGPHERQLSFVATQDGSVVGSVRMTRIAAGEGRALLLGPLAVRPDFKNIGIGRRLVAIALQAAAENNQEKPKPKKVWDLSKRPADHFMFELGYDNWASKPDSADIKGFNHSLNFYFMFDFPFKTDQRLSIRAGGDIGWGLNESSLPVAAKERGAAGVCRHKEIEIAVLVEVRCPDSKRISSRQETADRRLRPKGSVAEPRENRYVAGAFIHDGQIELAVLVEIPWRKPIRIRAGLIEFGRTE